MYAIRSYYAAFLVLEKTEEHFWKQEYAAGQAVGREARAGGLGVIRESAEQQHERIWGTGWTYPWHQEPPSGYRARRSGWIAGLAKGVDDSALIAANEPLGEPRITSYNVCYTKLLRLNRRV